MYWQNFQKKKEIVGKCTDKNFENSQTIFFKVLKFGECTDKIEKSVNLKKCTDKPLKNCQF